MNELMELNRTGDTRMQWDPANGSEVVAARNRFNELKKKGYASFRVNKSGSKGEQIDEFDPMEERIIMVPAFVGG